MQNKYKLLAKDSIVFAIGGIGSKLILFLLVPLYTNFLSTEEFGIADLVFTVAQIVIPLVSLVIFDAVLRFGASRYEKQENVVLIGFIVWFFSATACLFFSPLALYYESIASWKAYLVVYVIVSIGLSIEQSYVKAKRKNILYSITSIVQALLLGTISFLFLAVFKKSVSGYLLSNILSISASIVILFFAGGIFKDLFHAKYDPSLFRRMVAFSAPLILNNISWWIINSSDKLMIEFMISASALGLFTAASKIPSLINVVITIFSQAWGLSTIREVEDSNSTAFYSKVFSILSFLFFALAIFIILVIQPFMSVYVGKDFYESWKFVPLLLVSAVFSSISSFFGTFYMALKKTINNMITTVVAAVLNVVCNLIFINVFGIMGAVIGTVISYFAISLFRMFDVRRYVTIRINFVLLICNIIIVVVQAVLVSLNFYVYVVSGIAIVLFLLINCRTIFALIKGLSKKWKNAA